MRYSGIQPQYFPRLHYFARILAADVFMIRDDVQFVLKHKYPDGKVDKSYQVHTPIKQSFGRFLLAVPTSHHDFPQITQTGISYDQDWVNNHLKTLEVSYSRATNFVTIYEDIKKILDEKYSSLAELNITTILWAILRLLEEPRQSIKDITIDAVNKKLKKQKLFRLKSIKRASQSKSLKTKNNLSANEKIVALCQEIGANEDYCGGTGFAAYVDKKIFAQNGIKITVQDWKCQEYPQLYNKQEGFIPNLSIIDLLMNADNTKAAKIING